MLLCELVFLVPAYNGLPEEEWIDVFSADGPADADRTPRLTPVSGSAEKLIISGQSPRGAVG